MKINEYHGTYNRSKRSGGTSAIKYIVIHYTGGTGSAKNNCIYFSNGNRNASADYFIDDDGIWEYNDPADGYYTWHCGDGKGAYGITNSNSIGIETVSNGSDFTSTEISYLAELVQSLMKKYNVDSDHVVRHYDASRKKCPAPYITASKWKTLKATITSSSSTSSTSSTSTNTSSSSSSSSNSSTSSTSTLDVDGLWGKSTTKALQKQLGTTADGIVSNQLKTYKSSNPGLLSSSWKWESTKTGGSAMIKAMQKKLSVTADGYVGPTTIKALQKRMGTTQDGCISNPSACVKALQKKLNKGTF